MARPNDINFHTSGWQALCYTKYCCWKSSVLTLWLEGCFSLKAGNCQEIWKSNSGCYLCFVLQMPICKTVNPTLPKGALQVMLLAWFKSNSLTFFECLLTEVLCEVDGLYSCTSAQNLKFISATSTHGLFSGALQMNILWSSCGQML